MQGIRFRYGFDDERKEPNTLEFSTRIMRGECVLVTGPSGGGKSTLLRLINGLIPHYNEGIVEGEISIHASDKTFSPTTAPLWETGQYISNVFQNPNTQFFTTNVTSELAFPLENQAQPPAIIRNRIVGATHELGVQSLLGRSLFKLSGGERQAVATTGAYIQNPTVYLFDEPTSNLDSQSIEIFRQLLEKIKAQGATIVIAEHRFYFLKDLVDRVLIVDQTIAADMDSRDFFTMDDDARLGFGLRQLCEQTVSRKIPTFQISTSTGTFLSSSDVGVLAVTDTSGTDIQSKESLISAGKDMPAEANVLTSLEGAPSTNLLVDCAPGGLILKDFSFLLPTKKSRVKIPRLAFNRGKVTVIRGRNGIGKTTLIRTMCGLRKKFSGEILLDSQHITRRELLRSTHLVMQDVNRQLFTNSVFSELILGSNKSQSVDSKAEYALDRFNLSAVRNHHPLALSGGQKQRLVIAASMVLEREIYIFDEPTSGLDGKHLQSVADALTELASNGKIVIVVTHDDELTNLCADIIYELV